MEDYKNNMALIEEKIKEYVQEANQKLEEEYSQTREALLLLAEQKVKNYMITADIGLNKNERKLLCDIIDKGMMQSFCLGYGIGKIDNIDI